MDSLHRRTGPSMAMLDDFFHSSIQPKGLTHLPCMFLQFFQRVRLPFDVLKNVVNT